jgi:hypothetical protein
VRVLLLDEVQQILVRLRNMTKWLKALDPALQPSLRALRSQNGMNERRVAAVHRGRVGKRLDDAGRQEWVGGLPVVTARVATSWRTPACWGRPSFHLAPPTSVSGTP